MDKARCQETGARIADAGLELYAVAANNDFSSPVPEHRESQLANFRDIIQMTSQLGAAILRVFAAWPGITLANQTARYDIAERVWAIAHRELSPEQTWDLCRTGLSEAARWAEDAGVTLALQNHPPVTNSLGDILRLIEEVDSGALRACFDAPLAHKQGLQNMRAACRSLKSLQVLTHFGGEYERNNDGAIQGIVRRREGTTLPENFYADFTAGMLDIEYDGFTGYELCHPLPKRNGAVAGLDFVDENAKLACEFMEDTIRCAERVRS